MSVNVFCQICSRGWCYNSWEDRVCLSPGDVLFPSGDSAVLLMAARIEYKEIDRGRGRESLGWGNKKVGDDARVILITLLSMPAMAL